MADKIDFNDNTVRSILHAAIEHRRSFPVCIRKWEATLASGSAVAGISLRMIHDSLSSLKNQVNVACGNLNKENHFDEEKLQDHVKKIIVLWYDFNWIIGRKLPNSSKVQIINSIAIVFSKLPKKEIKEIQNLFDNIYKLFEYSENRMSSVVLKVIAKETEDIDIKSIVRIEIASKLALIELLLEDILDKIECTRQGIRTLWSDSVKTIKKDQVCNKKHTSV